MAGSISLSLSQQFDTLGNLLSGGRAYFIQAATVATPQNAFQDLGLTQPWPNFYTLPANGRLPQLYFADGYIKVRLTDRNGVEVFNQDNIPVVGPSSGGGGGGGVDPTTVLQTGWLVPVYGTGIISGFVRTNARTIGNASSGATERANADTAALFAFLWNADANLAVSGGRGVSAAADYAANKTIALPDFRGRSIAGLVDMGNTAATTLTTAIYGTDPTVLGAAGGAQSTLPAQANLPNVTLGVNGTLTSTSTTAFFVSAPSGFSNAGFGTGGGGPVQYLNTQSNTNTAVTSTGNASGSLATASINGSVTQTAMATVSPLKLVTVYLKL